MKTVFKMIRQAKGLLNQRIKLLSIGKIFLRAIITRDLESKKKQTATTALTSASTQKKKPGSKSSSKKPACYNEGAEESKGWMAEE